MKTVRPTCFLIKVPASPSPWRKWGAAETGRKLGGQEESAALMESVIL